MHPVKLYEQLENKIPVAPLGIIALPGAAEMAEKVNEHIVSTRRADHNIAKNDPAFGGYVLDDYRIPVDLSRVETGEGRALLLDSVRGKDIFIIVDVTNHSITYKINGFLNSMSPDDHFQDLKRVILAINGKARRIAVIMPFLYEGRQHGRSGRESLDASIMFRELVDLGITNFITFDAHDPRISSSAPMASFDNFTPPYQFLRSLMHSVPDLVVDKDHIVVISPDEGAVDRAVYFAGVIGVDVGMFYKRRDYTTIVGGKNPIVAHEFLGEELNGKDAIIIDDMISSGGSILDTSRQLKQKGAARVFLCTTFGLFTDGLAAFDKAYEEGAFDKVVTTNLTHLPPEVYDRPYFVAADMTKYMATIIDFINHDAAITNVSAPTDKIHKILERYNQHIATETEQEMLENTEF
ncbi:MAG: ribose-phosphate pyrophosphokinase [Lachnospiraceae bacterium]|nr:ribose-phosphate pyrophosphokinase [Lachnospiraceae bacterium]